MRRERAPLNAQASHLPPLNAGFVLFGTPPSSMPVLQVRSPTSSTAVWRSGVPLATARPTCPSRARAARPRRLQEAAAFAAVGRDLVHDSVSLDQEEALETLAELARLRVAEVDAIAD